MCIDGEQNDRNVRPDRVQILLARTGRRKCAIPPAKTANDVRVPDLGAIGLQRIENRFPGVELKVRASREGGPDKRMDVTFDKAGKQHFPGEVHDARLRSYEGPNACFVADKSDAFSLDRHGASPGVLAVHRVDRAVSENNVGARIRGGDRLGDETGCGGD